MKYPRLSAQNEMRAMLNNLSGGLNVRLPDTLINASEQSDILNMWFSDGALVKRPSISEKFTMAGFHPTDAQKDGKRLFMSFVYNKNSATVSGALVGEDGSFTVLNSLVIPAETNSMGVTTHVYSCFPFSGRDEIYLATGLKNENDEFYGGRVYILSGNGFILLSDDKIYAPLIMINGKGNMYYDLPASDNTVYAPSSSFEGVNLLTRRVRVQYTTDGKSYLFPLTMPRMPGTDIKVRLTGSFGTGSYDTMEVTLPDGTPTQMPGASGVYCWLRTYDSITFTERSDASTDQTNRPPDAAPFSGNLEIEFYTTGNENEQSIYEMNMSTWFGGSGGTGRGNRLFVSGNQSDKNLVRWSDLNNPLYFPDNNYAAVSDGEVKAMRRQGKMLVIFSDRQIHYATYVGGEFTASDVVNGSVIDVSAASAVFPITQLHGEIGIYSENAVCLLNGKLYFLGSDKKVYRIENSSSLTLLSENIEKLLYAENSSDAACGIYKGYFLLSMGGDIYAFNEGPGAWYLWKHKKAFSYIFGTDEKPLLLTDTGVYEFAGEEDFDYYFTTAMFSFDRPDRLKKICGIYVFSKGGSCELITDGGASGIIKQLKYDKKISAAIPKTRYLGLRCIDCDRTEGIVITYMVNGK